MALCHVCRYDTVLGQLPWVKCVYLCVCGPPALFGPESSRQPEASLYSVNTGWPSVRLEPRSLTRTVLKGLI